MQPSTAENMPLTLRKSAAVVAVAWLVTLAAVVATAIAGGDWTRVALAAGAGTLALSFPVVLRAREQRQDRRTLQRAISGELGKAYEEAAEIVLMQEQAEWMAGGRELTDAEGVRMLHGAAARYYVERDATTDTRQ